MKPIIGVMGSAREVGGGEEDTRLRLLANRLGRLIAERGSVLITGATTGFPDLISRSARSAGGVTIGISPAIGREEHVSRYGLPDDAADVIIYTGFGLRGRNVVNVRSSDIVIIFEGGFGTLNEFTIAYEEGKVIGVLEGTGGAADRIRDLVTLESQREGPNLIFDSNPEALVDACLRVSGGRALD